LLASDTPPDGAARPGGASGAHHTAALIKGKEADGNAAPTGLDAAAGRSGGGADPTHPHLFHLASAASSSYGGGSLQGAISSNWNILSGQQGSVYLARLKPGGVREPYWHPSAWELNFVISGKVLWSLVGPDGTHDAFDGAAGDLVFAPQGHFHYFENASDTDELVVLIAFNTDASEPQDDIGLVASFSALPADVLGAIFGTTSPETFRNIPRNTNGW
jgi:oxalate decarboxylase